MIQNIVGAICAKVKICHIPPKIEFKIGPREIPSPAETPTHIEEVILCER